MTDPAAPVPSPVEPPPAGPPMQFSGRPQGYGTEAVIALVFGLFFLYLAIPMITWAFNGFHANPYDLLWPAEHPLAGQPIPYFRLPYGEQWRDAGELATGLTLLIEAVLAAAATVRPSFARAAWRAVVLVALEGVALNFAAIVLQVRLGVTGPLYTLIGGLLCVLSAVAAFQHVRELGPAPSHQA